MRLMRDFPRNREFIPSLTGLDVRINNLIQSIYEASKIYVDTKISNNNKDITDDENNVLIANNSKIKTQLDDLYTDIKYSTNYKSIKLCLEYIMSDFNKLPNLEIKGG